MNFIEETAQGSAVERILSLDLEPIKFKLVHDDPSAWSRGRVDAAEREYRRFLILIAKFPDEKLVPAGDVDPFWHMHILDTAKYAADCEAIFGRFVHHFPYSGLMGDEDAAQQRANFIRTCHLYRTEFGDAYAVNAEYDSCDDCSPDYDCDTNGKLPSLNRARPRFSDSLAAVQSLATQ